MVLILCQSDNCNRSYKTVKALKTQGIDVMGFKTQPHKFNYPNQLPIVNIHRMVKEVNKAKVVWFTMGNPALYRFLKPHIRGKTVVTFSGTTYRQNSQKLDKVFNGVDLFILLGHDHMKLCSHDNKTYNSNRIIDFPKPSIVPNKVFTIGHYPSQPHKKGSDIIIPIMERLALKHGVNFKYSLVPVEYEKNLKRMSECDLYIEQYAPYQNGKIFGEIGNQAYEACAMGSIVISNLSDTSLYESVHGALGIHLANSPEHLEELVEGFINTPYEDILKLRAKSQEWVYNTHGLDAMGRSLMTIIDTLTHKYSGNKVNLKYSSKTDIVIPYAKSPNSRLSRVIDSIEINAKFPYRIVVIGDDPMDPRAYHIPHKRADVLVYPKMVDSWNKLRVIMGKSGISKKFIIGYDDVYWNNPITLDFFDRLIALNLPRRVNPKEINSPWAKHLQTTLQYLAEKGLPGYNYETHIPRMFDKAKVAKLLMKENFYRDRLLFATWYFNEYSGKKVPQFLTKESKIKAGFYGTNTQYSYATQQGFEKNCEEALFINHDGRGLTKELDDYLTQRYSHAEQVRV